MLTLTNLGSINRGVWNIGVWKFWSGTPEIIPAFAKSEPIIFVMPGVFTNFLFFMSGLFEVVYHFGKLVKNSGNIFTIINGNVDVIVIEF